MTEERTTTTIPFELISTYGASLPIMPNMLAELMGIQPAFTSLRPPEEWESLLAGVLSPRNISFISALTKKGELYYGSLLSAQGRCILCNIEEENAHFLEIEPKEVAELFLSTTAEREPPPQLTVTTSREAMFTFFSIWDYLRQIALEEQLNQLTGASTITADQLRMQWERHSESQDIRWMTNYVQDTLWEEFPVDFDTGLQELEELGILELSEDGLVIASEVEVLVREFITPKELLSLQSLFYEGEEATHLDILFIETEHFLWMLDLEEKASLVAISSEQAVDVFLMGIAEGDEPPITEFEEEVVDLTIPADPEARVIISDEPPRGMGSPWKCSCGNVNTNKFCSDCGAPQPEEKKQEQGKRFCRECGGEIAEDAKFCRHCGSGIQ